MKNFITIILFTFLTAACFAQSRDYEKGLKAFDGKDFKNAVKYLKPFADLGDSLAQYVVGYSYFNEDSKIKNDSIAEHYLVNASEKKFGRAMGLLSALLFGKSMENPKYKVDALVWAETAAAYDIIQKGTSTRFVIKQYLSEEELELAEKLLIEKKKTFDKIDLLKFKKGIPKKETSNPKMKIPENKLGLMEDPYRDWVSRWGYDNIECDTMYYTSYIDKHIIDSTINILIKQSEFKTTSLYSGKLPKKFTLTKDEQEFLIKELGKLKNYTWEMNLFPFSKRLTTDSEIVSTFTLTEKLSKEVEKNMCSIVYTFSRPIYIRNKTMVLFLNQQRYRGNYPQLSFNFYVFENGRWENYSTVYAHYESK